MSEIADPSGITDMLAKAAGALAAFQAGGQPGADADAEPPSGSGSGAGGMITVRATMPGRIAGLTLDPRVMRLDSFTLAEELERAVNAALADLQEQVKGGTADLGGLSAQLQDIQQSAVRQLSSYTDALVQAQERIAARGGR